MLLQLSGNPEPSLAAARAQPWGCPAGSEVWQHQDCPLQSAPWGQHSCLGQALQHLSLAVPAGHRETPRVRQGQQSMFYAMFLKLFSSPYDQHHCALGLTVCVHSESNLIFILFVSLYFAHYIRLLFQGS